MLYYRRNIPVDQAHLKDLVQHFKPSVPKLRRIEMEYGFVIITNAELSYQQNRWLKALLPDVDQPGLAYKPGNYHFDFWVVPRFGTTSAKVDAAREICLLTGVPAVLKIIECRKFKLKTWRKRGITPQQVKHVATEVIDPFQESIIYSDEAFRILEEPLPPRPVNIIDIQQHGISALHVANEMYRLHLSQEDLEYLHTAYDKIQRNPTDIEIVMYARLNTEPAHHNYFNARWTIGEHDRMKSLFEMIQSTNKPGHTEQYFYEHAAILQPYTLQHLLVRPSDKHYSQQVSESHILLKTETQNDVALVEPKSGAGSATGEAIRDEMACGRGAVGQMVATGYCVSNLNLPNAEQPWEGPSNYPPEWPAALEIVTEGFQGSALFANQIGQPTLSGFLRTLEINQQTPYGPVVRGFHMPVVFTAGVGSIANSELVKRQLNEDCVLVVIGGPAYSVGIEHPDCIPEEEHEKIASRDYTNVQRIQPDCQLRMQEVIKACTALGPDNPIMSLWDVGDGGLAVAVPELLQANNMGATLELRKMLIADTQMSPMELWACEASERMLLAVERESLDDFLQIADRERCKCMVLGAVTKQTDLNITDNYFHDQPVATPVNVLFDHKRQERVWAEFAMPQQMPFDFEVLDIKDAVARVLRCPAVADKSAIITLYDRSVGGLTARDQMIGPWQIPVADAAVICNDFVGYTGKAYALGERCPIALTHPAAAARMALGEAITNLAAAPIDKLDNISLAINWQLARGFTGEDAGLYQSVAAICEEICPVLGVSIVAGDEELDLRAAWPSADGSDEETVTAPQTVIVSAVAPVSDVRKIITPQLRIDIEDTKLILIDLGKRNAALAGSVLAQVYGEIGVRPPDLDDPQLLKNFFEAIQYLHEHQKLLAYHDRSDGGLFVTLCEMAFAAHCGIDCHLDGLHHSPIASLFAEELGAVIQVRAEEATEVLALIERFNLGACCTVIGAPNLTDDIRFYCNDALYFSDKRESLQAMWSEMSYELRAERDNADTAKQEYALITDEKHLGLTPKLHFDCDARLNEPYLKAGQSPKMAVLRELGSVGHVELAAAFQAAHFDVVDVTMTDLITERVSLNEFIGLAIAPGYTFADSLGAGYGLAENILLNHRLCQQFTEFFARNETFTLGVGNGAQVLLHLRDIIPGTRYWPTASENVSEQFESRLIQVKVDASSSAFFKDMQDSVLPVPIACRYGRLSFAKKYFTKGFAKQNIILQYVDSQHEVSSVYPYNPTGSEEGVAGFCNDDGRVTGLMVHPERVFRREQLSWCSPKWLIQSPWLRMFFNIREFVN